VILNGWLLPAIALHKPSPNFNARPELVDVSLLVVHNISLPPGEFGNGCIDQFFLNQLDSSQHSYFQTIADLCVSAHCMISRAGVITQYVSFDERAWHAGQSCFDGIDDCNNYSIGIELEGTDTTPYTHQQYVALVELTRMLQLAYPQITDSRIVGHCDIAPGRKTDPGDAFDWSLYRGKLALGV
jgi:Negative regulator of beta-lactamase expression